MIEAKIGEFRIVTDFNEDVIEQRVLSPFVEQRDRMVRQVIFLKDQGVREALAKLGWVSPEEAAILRAELRASKGERWTR